MSGIVKISSLFLCSLLFISCSTQKYDLLHTTAEFKLHIVKELPSKNKYAYAESHCNLDFKYCEIYVLDTVYPRCIAHEIRHVMEGHWHTGMSSEDCNIIK